MDKEQEAIQTAIEKIQTALELLPVLANLWHDGYVDLSDTRPIWAINGAQITVGDVRRARKALGLSIERG
jgi:hypothetical protein